MIIDKIIQEQKELNKQWEKRREKGLINFLIVGFIKSLIFISCAFLINAMIDKNFDINVFAIIVASLFIPIISWVGNEVRYRARR